MDEEKREAIKKRLQEKLKTRMEYRKKHYIKTEDLNPPPRYDDVYWQGVAWLDTL